MTTLYRDRALYHLFGPATLTEALAAAEEKDGLRVAVSSPEGRWLAIEVEVGLVYVRRLNDLSGQAGTVLGTGRWCDPAEVPVTIQWRPG